jgi:hypothetical protein
VILLLTAVSLILGSPAAAALVITNESFSPVPPLAGGDGQHAVTAITVIPAGATTFSRTHTLQMQTDLVNARWNIQVLVDGVPAAQQSASGTSAFVNGYLLSYPTTSDVSLRITIDGNVPLPPQPTVSVITVEEIDASGTVVPGSLLTVSPPVAGTPNPTPGMVLATPSSGPAPAAPSPAQTPGFAAGAGIGGLGLGIPATSLRRHRHGAGDTDVPSGSCHTRC